MKKSDPISWPPEYLVGITLIDKQHQDLMALANNVLGRSAEGKESEPAYIKSVLKEMVDYAEEHFSTEENIMRKTNFSGYAEHKKLHDGFVITLVDMVRRFNEGKKLALVDMAEFLKDWVQTHIGGLDRESFSYLVKSGAVNADGTLNVPAAG